MTTITLSKEAADLLFHAVNNHLWQAAVELGYERLKEDSGATRPLFGMPSGLHGEIIGALTNPTSED